jgi:hypothetical protein
MWPSLRQRSNTSNGSNGPAAVAAATQRTAATTNQSEEQQHTPHVSVLLQEVLHNLNHMPIKVHKPSGTGMAPQQLQQLQQFCCDHNSTCSKACAAASCVEAVACLYWGCRSMLSYCGTRAFRPTKGQTAGVGSAAGATAPPSSKQQQKQQQQQRPAALFKCLGMLGLLVCVDIRW